MRVIIRYIGMIVLPFILISCGFVPMERLGTKPISVSAGESAEESNSISSQSRSIRTIAINNDQYYKSDRQEAHRGSLLHQLTPKIFVLDIDDVVLYNRLITGSYISKRILRRVNSPAGIIPQHYDLVHASGIIRDAHAQNQIYDGLSLQFLPGVGSSNDGFYVLSIIGIELPKEYDGVKLPGEIEEIEGLPDGLRYFSFEHLQPIETNTGFLSYLTIGTDVNENWIQNPLGEIGKWVNPVTTTRGNAVGIYLSTIEQIDISSFEDPEILLHWDMIDLVEIWDNEQPQNPHAHTITFKLHDPFPVSLFIRENIANKGNHGSSLAPSDVIIPAIAGSSSYNTLQWINPQDEDFMEVSIVRKAGKKPQNRTDGEEVYRGYVPNYVDLTGTSGIHYFYLIQTVDYSGNYSDGVILDQVQN